MPDLQQGIENKEREGLVLGISDDVVWIDIGIDSLAVGSVSQFGNVGRKDTLRLFVHGSDPEDLYLVSPHEAESVRDWSFFERAFVQRLVITGRVTSVIKGGLTVDIGVSAFLPFSRSGARDDAMVAELMNKQVLCRIVELDMKDRDVVLDRRKLLEAADQWGQSWALEDLKPGTRVRGRVCSLTDFGAFVDLGSVDGLLHVGEMSWSYVEKASDVVSIGREIEAVVSSVDPKRGRVALTLKPLLADPWAKVGEKFHVGDRVRGKVTTVTDFGAFVELSPGIEGLAHQNDLSWAKKPIRPSELLKPGDITEFMVVNVIAGDRRIALGRKQLTKNPWIDIQTRYPVDSIVSGTVRSLSGFGAFITLDREIDGMLHVSDISEQRMNHPRDVLREGQSIRVRVLECDGANQRIRLGLKQVSEPTDSGAVAVTSLRQTSQTSAQPQEKSLVILEPTASPPQRADYSFYSKSVFVNVSREAASGSLLEALIFTILDLGYLPRIATATEDLRFIIRECQYGILDGSCPFETGVFLGCHEYGADMHRMKRALILTDGIESQLLGHQVKSYGGDVGRAMNMVETWIQKTPTAQNSEDRWMRYQAFREKLPQLWQKLAPSGKEPTMIEFIWLATKWLSTAAY